MAHEARDETRRLQRRSRPPGASSSTRARRVPRQARYGGPEGRKAKPSVGTGQPRSRDDSHVDDKRRRTARAAVRPPRGAVRRIEAVAGKPPPPTLRYGTHTYTPRSMLLRSRFSWAS